MRKRTQHPVSKSRRAILWIGLVAMLTSSGCYKWKPIEPSPPSTAQLAAEDELRIHLDDGTEMTLRSRIHVARDTLFGYTRAASPYAQTDREEIGIPMADIRRIEVRRGDTLATTGFILGAIVVVPGVALAISCASSDDDWFC